MAVNKLRVGYGTVNIDPPLGTPVAGYYVPRYGKGFLDSLEASAMVLECGEERAVLLSVDVCSIPTERCNRFSKAIEQATGLCADKVFLCCTHSHTAPLTAYWTAAFPVDKEQVERYADFLESRLCDAVKLALADSKPAKMGCAVGQAPERVAYIRRYKMKDGTTCTCPPINDPNIDYPLGTLDQRVNVLRFDREGGETVLLVNYGLHADTVNGELFSADWPGWMRKTLTAALGNVKCMFLNGAEGDVGSTHVYPSGGDMNDTEISFDNEMKSPGMARFVGRALAGTVLQVYDKVAYCDVEHIDMQHRDMAIPANTPAPEDMPRAREYARLHDEGRDDLIPYTAMELTTVVAEARRMVWLETGPKEFDLRLRGVRIGNVALVGIPGEPFTQTGVEIKTAEGWDMVLPCALTGGSTGYFPTRSAYDEGGYEARSSPFRAGVAELIAQEAKALLKDLQA